MARDRRLAQLGGMLLINGATGALGMSLVGLCQGLGLQIVGLGQNQEKLDFLAGKYPGGKFLKIKELSNEEEARQILHGLNEESQGSLFNYVHAAASLKRTVSPLETSVENFRETLETNLVGAFIWNKAVMGHMVSNSKHGSIVNVSSQAARTGGYGGTTSYEASKGGLVTLTKTFSRFGAPFNIRVNAISPGFLDNEMMTGGLSDSQISSFTQRTALDRLASNEEIASVIKFLIDSGSSYITGENLEVSGGLSLG
jgi:3-oxoacyl-[acyl-carrier protein] reductase